RKSIRLCPGWLTIVLACGAASLLVALYPEGDMKAKSLAVHAPSPLSLAYLEAGLHAQPDSVDYLDALADQNLKLGRWEQALSLAERMEALSQDDYDRQR